MKNETEQSVELFLSGASSGEDVLSDLYGDTFSGEMSKRWRMAKDARQEIEKEMLADLRRRDGEYEPEIKSRLEASGGSTIYDNVTDYKCAGIEAMLAEVVLFSNDPAWGLDPTTNPQMEAQAVAKATETVVGKLMEGGIDPASMEPKEFEEAVKAMAGAIMDEIRREAKARAERMESKIADQFDEGGFEKAMNEFIVDFATHKIAALMGPCPRMEKRKVVVNGGVDWEERLVLGVERVNPLDIYPESMSVEPGDGDFFIRKRIGSDAAKALKNVPEVKLSQLTKALAGKSGTATETVDLELGQIAEKNSVGIYKPDAEHELVYWWHWMTRKQVNEFTGDVDIEEELADEFVPMQGLMLNGVVIKAVENLNKSGKPNVFVGSFRKRPGSFWGIGGAGLAKGQQDQVNVMARAVNNNAHMASRPSYQVDQAALVDPKAMSRTFPGQVVYTTQMPGDNRDPVKILNTPNNLPNLIEARNQAASWLDEKTGVYPQSYGNPAQSGPAETLGGYQLLRQDQTKTMKRALYNVSQVVGGLVEAFWTWNMIFDEDESIKGDFEVVTRGAAQLYLTSEDADQMLAVIQMMDKSQMLQAVAKPQGAGYLFRAVLRRHRIDADKVLKSDEEMAKAAEEAMAQQQAMQGAENAPMPQDEAKSRAEELKAQAAMQKAQNDSERVNIQRARMIADVRRAQQDLELRKRGMASKVGVVK
jgi:hypothetical protein